MHKVCPPGVALVPLTNGSTSSTLQQTPSFLSDHATSSSKPDMFCDGGSSSAVTNGASLGNQNIQLANDVSQSLLSTHIGVSNGINATAVKSEPGYSNNSDINFFSDSSFLETRLPLGVEPGAAFASSELSGQPLSDPLLDIESPSFGFSLKFGTHMKSLYSFFAPRYFRELW